jgi:hypothetical protein
VPPTKTKKNRQTKLSQDLHECFAKVWSLLAKKAKLAVVSAVSLVTMTHSQQISVLISDIRSRVLDKRGTIKYKEAKCAKEG